MKAAALILALASIHLVFGENDTYIETETAMLSERSPRAIHIDLRSRFGNHFEENAKPRRSKTRRRKQKPRYTTPRYDFEEEEASYVRNAPKESGESNFEPYFKHPYIGNVGKIFNQKDINDYYLKENNDYAKLVNDVVMQNKNKGHNVYYPESQEQEDSYKTIVSYDKKDSTKVYPTLSSSWGNLKNYDHMTDNFEEYKHNDGWYSKPTKPATTYYDYNKYKDDDVTTVSPYKNYASSYTFDTKHTPESNKFKVSSYPSGRYTVKNTDYVSEFDTKGNPISPSALNDYINMNKDETPDFVQSFYDYNSNTKLKGGPYYTQPSYESTNNNKDYGKGYASSYNYSPYYDSNSYESQSGSYKNVNYDNQQENHYYSQSMPMSHPILVPVPQPYPVQVPIAKPVAVPIVKEIKVPIEKVIPYPVIKNVPYPIEKHIPVPVEKKVPVPVPHPVPVKIPIIKNVYHHAHEDENHDHNNGYEHNNSYEHEHEYDHKHNHKNYNHNHNNHKNYNRSHHHRRRNRPGRGKRVDQQRYS